MKHVIYIILLVFVNCQLASQSVLFKQSNDLISPVAGFTTFSDCIVDMNGDYLDDVVRVGGKGLFIDYQQKDGSFSQRQFNFPLQSLPSWSICAGDIDNNGYNDLLFAHSSSVSFIKANSNGTAYSESLMPDSIESQRSTMADINNDGWLDAFVCHESGKSKSYRNLGEGFMIPDPGLIPTSNLVGNYAAIWTDYDNDMDIDLYITKCWESALPGDTVRTNLLYRNNNDGTFTEIGAQAGLNDNAQGWSTAIEDFDNDGDFDAFIINHDFANRLMRNNGDGTFNDVIQGSGIDPLDLLAYEASSGDFNNDGFIDIFSDLTLSFYLGNGDLTFVGQDAQMIPGGVGDLNNDGSLDILQDNKIWLNEGNANHWIKINTLGYVSNRNGIGSRIEIYGAWGIQIREVRSGQAYSPMNSLSTHFGLGLEDHVDSLIVKWPSGVVTKLSNLVSDTTYMVAETSCLLPGITLDVSGPILLCPGETISVQAPDGFINYDWSNGDTTQWTEFSQEGNYFVLLTDSLNCLAVSDFVSVQIIEEVSPYITSDAGTYLCDGDTITLYSSPGENYRWSTGEILTQQIEVTQSGNYSVAVDAKCFDGQIKSDPFDVVVLQAPSPASMDFFVLPGDSVLLTAIGENIHWYDQPIGGNLLATGNSFQTTVLNDSVTYYIESHHVYEGAFQSGGKPDTIGAGSLPSQDGHLSFDVWDPFTLVSVDAYVPTGGPLGVRFVQLISNDSLAASKSFIMHEGLNVLELDYDVSLGSHVLTCPQGNLFRNEGDLDYPYPIGDAGQITGSSNGGNYYYYFYNWQIQKHDIICVSERIAVQVIVTSDESINIMKGLKVFPNPVEHVLFIQSETEIPAGVIKVLDYLGNELLLKNPGGGKSYEVQLQHLPPGSYLLQLITNEFISLYRVIKL